MGSYFSKDVNSYKPSKGFGTRVDSLIDDSWNLMLLRWELLAIPIDDERFFGLIVQWHAMYVKLKERYDFEMAVWKNSGQNNGEHFYALERCLGMMTTMSNNRNDNKIHLSEFGNSRCWTTRIERCTKLLLGIHRIWTCPIDELRQYIENSNDKIHEQTNCYFGKEIGLTDGVYNRNMVHLRNILFVRENPV